MSLEQISNKDTITPKNLTKFELAKVIGTRAMQITMNYPIMVELDSKTIEPMAIAEQELKEGKMPIVIRRILPNGMYEDCDVNKLIIFP